MNKITKKISSASLILALVFFAFGAFFAFPAYAQATTPKEDCTLVKEIKVGGTIYDKGVTVKPLPGTDTLTIKYTDDWGTICLVNTINTVVDWVFIFLLAVAVALIAIAGFLWMTGGAKPDQQKLAGQMIMGSVIGIVIAILARVIPALVTGILL